MLAPECVEHVDVDLGAIEGAVLGVQLPRAAVGVERRGELRLRVVPRRDIADVLLGARGEEHLVLEPELAVHKVDEAQHLLDLRLHVVGAAEDVRVVLLEAPHAREPRERARELVAVQHAEVRDTPRELAE